MLLYIDRIRSVLFSGLSLRSRCSDPFLDLLIGKDLHRIVGQNIAQARPNGCTRHKVPAIMVSKSFQPIMGMQKRMHHPGDKTRQATIEEAKI